MMLKAGVKHRLQKTHEIENLDMGGGMRRGQVIVIPHPPMLPLSLCVWNIICTLSPLSHTCRRKVEVCRLIVSSISVCLKSPENVKLCRDDSVITQSSCWRDDEKPPGTPGKLIGDV